MRRAIAWIGPDFGLVAAFTAVLIARSQATRAVRGILRDWGPAILIMWLFQSLETYTGVIRQTSNDDILYRADLWLFGVEPTV